ncbi:MAG: DUF167 domain-containing protein [Nitrosospira sp.]|nr:DUF167 domain-containing protein [Nitrosospira sp.]
MPGNGNNPRWCHCESSAQRLTLILHIQPGAKRTEAVGLHGDALKIRLAAPPLKGAASAALLEFLAGVFGVLQRQVTLKQGIKSRQKVIGDKAVHGRAGRPVQAIRDVGI